MKSRLELYMSREYWIDGIQNDIFRALHAFKEKNGIKTNSELAEKLGYSKGYISQIMNGNFNFSLSKLVDLALSINMVPDLEIKSIEKYTTENEARLERMNKPGLRTMISLKSGNQFRLDRKIEDPRIAVG